MYSPSGWQVQAEGKEWVGHVAKQAMWGEQSVGGRGKGAKWEQHMPKQAAITELVNQSGGGREAELFAEPTRRTCRAAALSCASGEGTTASNNSI